MASSETAVTPLIESRISLIHGHKVMLDADLASLYEVETRRLNEAVRRNRDRFPEDFMFQLSRKEDESFEIADCDLKRRPRHRLVSQTGLRARGLEPR